MATAMDWFPTILDLAAIPFPEDGVFDGRSLLPMLKDPSVSTPHDFLFWQLGANPQTAQWAIRSEKWKLLGNAYESELGRSGNKVLSENKELMLIDLSSDVGEIDNLASRRPDIVNDLLNRRQQIIDSL
jgi:arylsulfatase A-like enzyme